MEKTQVDADRLNDPDRSTTYARELLSQSLTRNREYLFSAVAEVPDTRAPMPTPSQRSPAMNANRRPVVQFSLRERLQHNWLRHQWAGSPLAVIVVGVLVNLLRAPMTTVDKLLAANEKRRVGTAFISALPTLFALFVAAIVGLMTDANLDAGWWWLQAIIIGAAVASLARVVWILRRLLTLSTDRCTARSTAHAQVPTSGRPLACQAFIPPWSSTTSV
ncbi:hypothetical protein [Mycolicibacterium sp. XJ775]